MFKIVMGSTSTWWRTFCMIIRSIAVFLLSHRYTAFSRCSLSTLVPSHPHTTSCSVHHTARWERSVRWLSPAPPCIVPHVVWRRLEIIQLSYRFFRWCSIYIEIFWVFSSFLTHLVETKLIKDEMASLIHNRISYRVHLLKCWLSLFVLRSD